MSKSWYQVSCDVRQDIADAVAQYLGETTGCGVCTENRKVDAFSHDEIPVAETVTVTGYLSAPCRIEEYISRLASFISSCGQNRSHPLQSPKVSLISEEDWANSWKDLFRPISVGQRLLVTPSWLPPASDEGRLVVTIDPGMAFGTGGHETTMLCLECLEEIASSTRELSTQESSTEGLPVLDLGTGSGILAIAASKLGARHVDAIDIDQDAVSVARENCRINGVEDRVDCRAATLDSIASSYGLILANILAEELVRLAPDIVKRLHGGGYLVLSGILAEKENYVIEGFKPYPLTLDRVMAAGEWRCIRYRRDI